MLSKQGWLKRLRRGGGKKKLDKVFVALTSFVLTAAQAWAKSESENIFVIRNGKN